MTFVTVTGKCTDANGTPIPAAQQPRLWAVPEGSSVTSDGAITGDEIDCNLQADGAFSVLLNNEIRYSLWLDRLPPSQASEQPGKRSRTWEQWTEPFWPDIGGPIDDLVDVNPAVGQVYISDTVSVGMSPVPRFQILFNPNTDNIYERVVTY